MATDYFSMMRDVVGSYGEGLDLARARRKSDAEEARKETLFNQEQEQYKRKLGIQQGTDAAFGSYKALQNGVYDGSKADFGAVNPAADAGPVQGVAPIGAVGGGAIPKRAASRRDMLDARKNIAVAAQDYGSLGKLEEESRGVEWDDTFAKHIKGYSGSPEQIADAAKHINTNSKAITLHDPDKQGFRQMSVVAPDGTATLLKLGKHDQAQLWAASQMMDLDPQRALAIMHGIDKNLAAAVAAENGIVDKVGQHQNTMAYNKGQLAIANERTGIARAAAGSKTRELDQQTVEKLNNLSAQISEERDHKARAILEAQYRREFAQAATKLGKVLQPQGERAPKPEFTPKDVGDEIQRLQGFREFSKTPYDVLRQKAIENLSGVQSRGLDDSVYGSAPKQAPAAAIQKPTAAARPVAQAPVYLPGDSDVAAQAVYEGRPVVAGQYGLPTPSKYRVTNDEVEAALAAQYGLK